MPGKRRAVFEGTGTGHLSSRPSGGAGPPHPDLATRGIAMAPGQGLADLMAYRGPLYEKYADLIVDCLPGQTLAQTTGAVLDCLSQDLSAPAHGVNVGQTAAIRLRSESEKEGSNDIS